MIVEILSLLAATCYTLSGILVVFGMKNANPTTATFISMLVNLAVLWPIALVFSPLIFDKQAILLYAISAAFAPIAGRLLNYLSLERVGVSTTTSILGLQPIFVSVLAAIFLSERFEAIVYIAIIITVTGVIITGRSHSRNNKTFNKEDLILPLSASFCYSSSNITRKEGLKIVNVPFLAAAVTSSFSALYLFLYLLLTRRTQLIKVVRSSWTFFIFSGLVNSFAWISSFQALNIGEASIVSTILGTQPIIAIILSSIFLKKTEAITMSKILGASLVVLGVALISILR